MQSYLDHQADKLAHRFDAGSYVVLTDAMTTWDVGRGRGGADDGAARRSACRSWSAASTATGSTRCTSRSRSPTLVPATVGGLRVVASPYGHDGFLVEREQVFALVEETLDVALSDAA